MQDLQDQEESVRIAVRALGDMRNATTRSLLLLFNPFLKGNLSVFSARFRFEDVTNAFGQLCTQRVRNWEE